LRFVGVNFGRQLNIAVPHQFHGEALRHAIELPLNSGWFFWNIRLAPLPVEARAGCLAVGLFPSNARWFDNCHAPSEIAALPNNGNQVAACRLCRG
jgi:hypothetical protein